MILSGFSQPLFSQNINAKRYYPEPDPPKIEKNEKNFSPLSLKSEKSVPTQEWIFHKTSDNSHPDGVEQQMVWFMNRARSNPSQEGIWLAKSEDSRISNPRDYFNVDVQILQDEFASYSPKPPAAFDVRLYNAAKTHSEDLILRDAQDHTGQFDKIDNAGFSYFGARGNVFSYADDGVNAHAGFNIDWGFGTSDGMQLSRGHRQAIMSLDGEYTNVGFAAIPELNSATNVGPLVVTQNFCKAASVQNHYNLFIVGTVWKDTNDNDMYDPGEGKGGVSVIPDIGDYYAITSDSGGYAIPIKFSGTYHVMFSGTSVTNWTDIVTIENQSVLSDYKIESVNIVKGDINNDDSIDLKDVIIGLMTFSNNTSASDIINLTAEVNGDEKIGLEDVLYILKTIVETNSNTFSRSETGNTVTDFDTNLMWQDSKLAFKDESEGITYCESFSLDDFYDWRLPTFDELQTFFKKVNNDSTFDLKYWGTFSGCTASVAIGGYVKTPAGAEKYGGDVGDRINFMGGAAARCVRVME
ncbi:protein containing DUF1566 [Candidatus Magnetomorum sp. HK-1]|nr:protein containing DUF1566 [Candidatus Magnetomorum sp. HK-1]